MAVFIFNYQYYFSVKGVAILRMFPIRVVFFEVTNTSNEKQM
jgi:hypothetical protein